jgi:hypothetical protein
VVRMKRKMVGNFMMMVDGLKVEDERVPPK